MTAELVRGALLGLAAGDAAGWPAARHRAAILPAWTRRLVRELDTFAEAQASTTLPVPMALNQPPGPLRLGPSDDAEWAAHTALTVLPVKESPLPEVTGALHAAWLELAARDDIRARISVRTGLTNLASGARPPASGHDNPHFFDDAACARAVALAAIAPGDPARAAALAEFDARYTQDDDGVSGARAIAVALAVALHGGSVHEAAEAALCELPEGTEIARNAKWAIQAAVHADSAFAVVPDFDERLVDHVYSYGIAAAETVPIALGLAVAADGELPAALAAAACLSRVADSAPALTGALTGAVSGMPPDAWVRRCRILPGCALPWLADTDLVDLAERMTG